jgi:hypothetical protein
MSNIINYELISLANTDESLINLIKGLVISRFLHKKLFHVLWHILHSFSVLYPETPNQEQRQLTKDFILNIKANLKITCTSCSNNVKDDFIENNNLDLAVSSKNTLIQFFCDYHVKINSEYRHQINKYDSSMYNIDYIINKYSQNDYVSLIENIYDINLFKLFETNQLNSFFVKFENVKKQIYSEKFTFNFNFMDCDLMD